MYLDFFFPFLFFFGLLMIMDRDFVLDWAMSLLSIVFFYFAAVK